MLYKSRTADTRNIDNCVSMETRFNFVCLSDTYCDVSCFPVVGPFDGPVSRFLLFNHGLFVG